MSNPFAGIVNDEDVPEFIAKWRHCAPNDPPPPSNLREALGIWDVWVNGAEGLMPGETWDVVWRDEHLVSVDGWLEIILNHPDTLAAIYRGLAAAGLSERVQARPAAMAILDSLGELRGDG